MKFKFKRKSVLETSDETTGTSAQHALCPSSVPLCDCCHCHCHRYCDDKSAFNSCLVCQCRCCFCERAVSCSHTLSSSECRRSIYSSMTDLFSYSLSSTSRSHINRKRLSGASNRVHHISQCHCAYKLNQHYCWQHCSVNRLSQLHHQHSHHSQDHVGDKPTNPLCHSQELLKATTKKAVQSATEWENINNVDNRRSEQREQLTIATASIVINTINTPADTTIISKISTEQRRHSSNGNRCHRLPRQQRQRSQSFSGAHGAYHHLLLATFLLLQIITVDAMLDALKALFILTGASTYLVTKYVNITNNRSDVAFLADYNQSFNGSFFKDPGLNFFKGDHTGTRSVGAVNTMRPLYVLAVEEEEEEQSMPKLLLKLSISNSLDTNHSSPTTASSSISPLTAQSNLSAKIEYILDAKMDDLSDVYKNFAVNKTTGELFLLRPLDRDPPNGRATWRFTVQARNRQTLMILALADVLITVRDINDNKPMFEQKIYKTTLMENGPAGQILTKLTAEDFDDADTADNGKVVYSLVKSINYGPLLGGKSASEYFQLDPHTGVLTALACCFDREKQPEYRLVARATDAGGLSDEATVLVTIGDVNDCAPKFLNPSRTLLLNYDNLYKQIPSDLNSKLKGPEEENIYTFYVSDCDLPESNHYAFDVANATNCSLFQRFVIVTNNDGSGSLFGKRNPDFSELKWNKTYTCLLDVVVRDSAAFSGQVYEDLTTLTLVFRNNSHQDQFSEQNTSNANAVVALDESMLMQIKSEDQQNIKQRDGPKAYDLTGKRVVLSECSLCQNGGQCIVTETGYRFKCFCQSGFEGALCERAQERSSKLDQMLSVLTANELLLYCSLVIVVNLFVIVLGLMVWMVKRIRHRAASERQTNPSLNFPEHLTHTHQFASIGETFLVPFDANHLVGGNSINGAHDEKVQLQLQPYVHLSVD